MSAHHELLHFQQAQSACFSTCITADNERVLLQEVPTEMRCTLQGVPMKAPNTRVSTHHTQADDFMHARHSHGFLWPKMSLPITLKPCDHEALLSRLTLPVNSQCSTAQR